jgi:hypothetical protein
VLCREGAGIVIGVMRDGLALAAATGGRCHGRVVVSFLSPICVW